MSYLNLLPAEVKAKSLSPLFLLTADWQAEETGTSQPPRPTLAAVRRVLPPATPDLLETFWATA